MTTAGYQFLERPLGFDLPTPRQTALLRAALWPDDSAWEEFGHWIDTSTDPLGELVGRQGGQLLAPLLSRHSHREMLPSRLATYLRTARVREELRGNAYIGIVLHALAAIGETAPRPILIRGAGLAISGWPVPLMRHSGSIDLLTGSDATPAVASRLGEAGFAEDKRASAAWRDRIVMRHSSGLPVNLHFDARGIGSANLRSLPGRSASLTHAGVEAAVLSTPDQLAHAVVLASRGWDRANLLWVCDAWYLLQDIDEDDWERVCQAIAMSGVAVRSWLSLKYVSDALGCLIPACASERGETIIGSLGRLEGELELSAAWPGTVSSLMRMLGSTDDWRERAVILQTIFAPSKKSLVAQGKIDRSESAARFHLNRWRRWLANTARKRLT